MGPLRRAFSGKHHFNCSGDAVDRGEWPTAQRRWCCKKQATECSAKDKTKGRASMLSTTSRSDATPSTRNPHMDCKEHKSQELMDWCCLHQGVLSDCRSGGDSVAAAPALSVGPPPPRSAGKARGSAAEAGLGNEGQAWPFPGDKAKVKLKGCDTLCEYQGQASTCKFRIQWAATHHFLWRHGACRQGYEAVLRMCPSCSSCALATAGCVTPAPTTQKPPTTASVGGVAG